MSGEKAQRNLNTGSTAILSARDISVNFDGVEVLKKVSLDLIPGNTLALLGPNGAGKSTLLKALNGTVMPSSGEILLNGEKLEAFSRREIAQLIAVVAQENETKFPVTVKQYVLAARFARGAVFGWENEADVAAAERALLDCHLHDLSDRVMNNLSGGERQRVVLARALATEARILLLDEPTANLDLAHQAMMFRLVRERCEKNGVAAVVITHDLNLAAGFADSAILLAGGKKVAAGDVSEVLTKPNIEEAFEIEVLMDINPANEAVRVTAVY
ncbi:MAG TPA: ABC transporter ATP-binding protein [Pyrinomonadaceae bacterium]|nr:ABC transporter ATP-binding protein [Pyrinomonadaceae bacterium]